MPLISLRSESCQVRHGVFSPVCRHSEFLTSGFYHGPNFVMNMKADLWLRPPASVVRSKLLERSFQSLFSCGLSECYWPEGFSPASSLHLPIPPHQAVFGGGQVVVLLKKRPPCSKQPAQAGHFPCTPLLVLSPCLSVALIVRQTS